jgi:polyphosphate kinase 2
MINYDVSEYNRLNSDLYRKEKRSLQIEFLKLQNWAIKEEKKIAVVFEGRDTAGKTDTINLLARHLIPDHFRYVHLGIPTPNESKKWFKRYEKHMPKKGEIVFFDRSWYTRATVEITMGYCSKRQYTHFMNKVVRWEKSYIEEDLILIKFYLSIEKRQQSKRIKQRQNDPLKLWKLSPNDLRMADKWEIFSFFKEQMFSNTSYEQSPWIVINANNKMVARLTALRYLLNEIDYEGKKLSKPKTWDVGINNYKIEHKGVEFTGLTYQQLKLLQKLIQNQSN